MIAKPQICARLTQLSYRGSRFADRIYKSSPAHQSCRSSSSSLQHQERVETTSAQPLADESLQIRKPKKAREPPIIIQKPHFSELGSPEWDNAALLIDKQKGWSSFDVCKKLRGMLQIGKKIGHAGTLDPNATGLLIVCLNKGTKSIDGFVGQQKEYTGSMRLGEATLSYDADLPVSERCQWDHIKDADLESVASNFSGDLMQEPPMYSAVKVKGERLYHAARRGDIVERVARPITVTELELSRDANAQQQVDFRVVCSKGTYIRSLVHDMGQSLGSAAHMTSLRRTRIGDYHVDRAWTLEELQKIIDPTKTFEERTNWYQRHVEHGESDKIS